MEQDNGFVFNGRHSLIDMGLICVKGKKRYIGAGAAVDSYSIGGISGTMAYSDDRQLKAYTQQLTLYADRDLSSETEAQRLWREVRSWLCAGRRGLIWDSEPDIEWQAECTKMEVSSSEYIDEVLTVTLTIQPEGRSVRARTASLTVTDAAAHQLIMSFGTGSDAPVTITLQNTGTAPVTGIILQNGTDMNTMIWLRGISLTNGQALEITTEIPAGARIIKANGSVTNALPYAVSFGMLRVNDGDSLNLMLTFGDTGNKSAAVTTSVRGCWL